MADRARELLDAYAARDGGQSGGATIGELAPEAIAALSAVLAYADDLDKVDLYAAPAHYLRTTIRTALEAP